jgi:hypothetical protein
MVSERAERAVVDPVSLSAITVLALEQAIAVYCFRASAKPRSPRPPPETRSASSASGWTASTVAVLQCCTGKKTAGCTITTGR